jgi:hypothetical protein
MSTEWFVSYTVPQVSGEKVHVAGPYKSEVDAEFEAADIGAYQGVTGLKVYSENATELVDGLLQN